MPHKFHKKLKHFRSRAKNSRLERILPAALVVIFVAFIGVRLFYFGHAATFATSAETENGTLSGSASTISDANASNGAYVKFGNNSNGRVHVSGTTLVDASGKHIHMAGVDDGRMDPGEGNTPDKCGLMYKAASSSEAALIHSMGFNMDRVGVTWSNLEPTAPTINSNGTLTHHWNTQYLAALDGEIAAMRANGIMVVLDMHQASWSPFFTGFTPGCEGHGMPAWLYTTDANSLNGEKTARCEFFNDIAESGVPEKPQEGMQAAWSMLAAHYASNTTVIGADEFNEPVWPATCTPAPNLPAFMEKMGVTIRAANPNIILMYEDADYGTYVSRGSLLTRKPNLTNALYSAHFYPSTWSVGQPTMAAYLSRAHSWNVPIWIGETDAMTGTQNPPTDSNWQSDLTSMMNYFKQNDISWSVWAYSTGGYTVVVPGTSQPKTQLINLLSLDM